MAPRSAGEPTGGMAALAADRDDSGVLLPAFAWVINEPPSIKAEPIACSTVNFSCSSSTANSIAKGTCSWTTGAVRFTPISWLDL